jgi:hypothetical protein
MTSDPNVSITETEQISSIIFPNPTNNTATISTEFGSAGNVRITLDNLLGEELMEIHNGFADAGIFTKQFSISALPQGAYYLKIIHNGNVKIEKMIKN